LPGTTFCVKGLDPADSVSQPLTVPEHTAAVGALTDWIQKDGGREALTAVGHRVVYGEPKHYKPERITAEMIAGLHRLNPFDSYHLPEEILLTQAFLRRLPDLPQVGYFDTPFHHDPPHVAQMLPIPRRPAASRFASFTRAKNA
jgi:acetate kinase